jgi:hypothetical protein
MIMNIQRRLFAATLVFIVFSTVSSRANADHKDWLKFFEGKWTTEGEFWNEEDGWTKLNTNRDTELLVSGNAVVEKRTTDDGDTMVVVLGWNPAKKAIVETGYTSTGIAWTATYDTITEDSLEGVLAASFPDGGSGKGRIELDRKSDKAFMANWQLKTSDGKVLKGKLSITR